MEDRKRRRNDKEGQRYTEEQLKEEVKALRQTSSTIQRKSISRCHNCDNSLHDTQPT